MDLRIEPTPATLGAVVTGIELARASDAEWQRLLEAFHERAVLVLPDQHLTAQDQIAFASRIGEIEQLAPGMDTVPVSNEREDGSLRDDDDELMRILRGNEGWHTDSSYMPLASKASVLSAPCCATVGWRDRVGRHAGCVRRARRSDEATKRRVADLSAYHSLYYSQGKIGHVGEAGSSYGFHDGDSPLRPLVKTHPVTGRRSLFIGRHAYSIPGLREEESEALLDELVAFACRPPRTFLHRWQPGDVVVWDNRCVLHRARPYDRRRVRVMMHTRIAGDPATELAPTS